MALLIEREYHKVASVTVVFKGHKAKMCIRVEVSPTPSSEHVRDYEIDVTESKLIEKAYPDAAKHVEKNGKAEIKSLAADEIREHALRVAKNGESLSDLTATQKEAIKRRITNRLIHHAAEEMGQNTFATVMRHLEKQGVHAVAYDVVKMLATSKAKDC